jgi:hypothetical protein
MRERGEGQGAATDRRLAGKPARPRTPANAMGAGLSRCSSGGSPQGGSSGESETGTDLVRTSSRDRSAGCPAPLPTGATTGYPVTVPLRAGRSVARSPFPKLDSDPVARLSALAPFTLTRLPVPSSVTPPTAGPRKQLGCPRGSRSVLLCPWPPASRRLGASKRAPPLAAPVARDSSLRSEASRPGRSRLLLVSRSRFPPR